MPVAAGVQDGEHPAPEGPGFFEAGYASEGLQSGLLYRVLRFLTAPQPIKGVAVQVRVYLPVQPSKGGGIPAAGALY